MPSTPGPAPKQGAGQERPRNDTTHYVFMAGALSGVMEGVSIQPLEMIKTRFQINEGARLRIIPTIKDIIKEGGVLQLYRGGLPEIVGLMPRASASLSTLELSRRKFREWNGGELSTQHAFLSGALSGVSEGVAFSPFQVIKVRLMAKEHLGRYANTWDCLRKVVASEGVMALTTGLGPTMWRNTVWNGLYYGSMHEADKALPALDSEVAAGLRTAALGLGLGMLATCFNAPFDVVKSRFQAQLPGGRYRSTWGTLLHISRHEGPSALYRGFLPKAIRLGVGQTIGLMVFQKCLALVGASEAQHERQQMIVMEGVAVAEQ